MGKGSVITVRVSMSEKTFIDEVARGRNMSLSNFIREAVLSHTALGGDKLETATDVYRLVVQSLSTEDLIKAIERRASIMEEAFLKLIEEDLK